MGQKLNKHEKLAKASKNIKLGKRGTIKAAKSGAGLIGLTLKVSFWLFFGGFWLIYKLAMLHVKAFKWLYHKIKKD